MIVSAFMIETLPQGSPPKDTLGKVLDSTPYAEFTVFYVLKPPPKIVINYPPRDPIEGVT